VEDLQLPQLVFDSQPQTSAGRVSYGEHNPGTIISKRGWHFNDFRKDMQRVTVFIPLSAHTHRRHMSPRTVHIFIKICYHNSSSLLHLRLAFMGFLIDLINVSGEEAWILDASSISTKSASSISPSFEAAVLDLAASNGIP
jgi:hypothetical protein